MSQGNKAGESPDMTIHFRNPHSIAPVIVQMFMIFSAILIITGLVYVAVLVLAITIHHFIWDRNPAKVPEFVKKSIQFSSESEDNDDNTDVEQAEGFRSGDEPNQNLGAQSKNSKLVAANTRKTQNLNKFLSKLEDYHEG